MRNIHEYAVQVTDATPAERDRYVDLLRGFAIVAVVLGHWLAVSITTREDGAVDGVSVLTVADWTHWLTWLFQVMPMFFLVGGYANATSWERHARAGGTWAAWVHRRSVRLLHPSLVFVAVSIGAVVVARAAGADPVLVDRAGWLPGIVLWFLAVYVGVAGLTPLTFRLHRRFGLGATLGLGFAVAAGDVARIATGQPAWAVANFLLGWALIHQLGYWWRDGALPSGAGAVLVVAAGALALLGLVVGGPWPVAMVDVPGTVIRNSSPPSLALLALAAVQTGVALAAAGPVRAWLRRPLPWTAVVAVNRAVLTLFLWHMVAVVLAALALYQSGVAPQPEPLTATWWWWRPVWVTVLTGIAAVLVALFAPVEQRAARPGALRQDRPGTAALLASLGVPLACGGLVMLTVGGLAGDGPLGIPVAGASALTAGTVLTTAAGRFAPQP